MGAQSNSNSTLDEMEVANGAHRKLSERYGSVLKSPLLDISRTVFFLISGQFSGPVKVIGNTS